MKKRLNSLEGQKLRYDAWAAYEDAQGDTDLAEKMLRTRYQVDGVEPWMISLLVSVAIRLFEIWMNSRQKSLSITTTHDEARALGFESD